MTKYPIIYTSFDYEGPLNIKAAEKALILRSSVRCENHQGQMAVFLKIDPRTLYDKILAHGLGTILFSKDRKTLIISELANLEKNYPLIFWSKKKFDILFPNAT